MVLSRDGSARVIGAVQPQAPDDLAVAYGAGLRLGEVIALKVGDIDSQRMRPRVPNGTGAQGPPRHTPAVAAGTSSSRVARRGTPRAESALPRNGCFPRLDPMDPLTTRQRNRAILAGANAAGIDKKRGRRCGRGDMPSPTHLLEQKVDIRVSQVLLGHKKLDTTSIYTPGWPPHVRELVSPLDVTQAP
ncbi:MAG: tyrosine-type recombinase/integrase [Ideonella sp.]|nr:tyrosine-type recombinase/integrase [Ideonella sp.]